MSKSDKVTHGVESVGVDYGVYRYYANDEKLLVMVEKKENAERIAEILNADWHGKTLTVNDGWIPVSERLPDKPRQRVLVTVKRMDIATLKYEDVIEAALFRKPWNGNENGEFIGMDDAIAWREDIEPYKKGD